MAGYRHVVNNGRYKGARPVAETTTNLSFVSVKAAAAHFDIAENVIVKYANGRAKQPKFTYRFKWIDKEKQD